MNDTLDHCDCTACAVGNLIRASMGTRCISWFTTLSLYRHEGIAEPGQGARQMASTGYSIEQLDGIERAFECSSQEGDWMFNGLMAVVDVLAEIHGIDLTTKESAIGQFKEVQRVLSESKTLELVAL